MRNHKIKIGFFDQEGNVKEVQTVDIRSEYETVIKFENHNYKIVILNYEDWDFVKTWFDKSSL